MIRRPSFQITVWLFLALSIPVLAVGINALESGEQLSTKDSSTLLGVMVVGLCVVVCMLWRALSWTINKLFTVIENNNKALADLTSAITEKDEKK